MLRVESILELFVHFEEASSRLLRQQMLSLQIIVRLVVKKQRLVESSSLPQRRQHFCVLALRALTQSVIVLLLQLVLDNRKVRLSLVLVNIVGTPLVHVGSP